MPASATLNTLREKLRAHPELTLRDDGNRISVLPGDPSGFEISISLTAAGSFTVSFDGWHEEIVNPAQALNCFVFGLSDRCRLRVLRRGRFAVRWTMEAKTESGDWRPDSTVGLLISPFWLKATEVILQNRDVKGLNDHAGDHNPPSA